MRLVIMTKGKKLAEGTIRTHGGKKVQKKAGKWVPYSEGAKKEGKVKLPQSFAEDVIYKIHFEGTAPPKQHEFSEYPFYKDAVKKHGKKAVDSAMMDVVKKEATRRVQGDKKEAAMKKQAGSKAFRAVTDEEKLKIRQLLSIKLEGLSDKQKWGKSALDFQAMADFADNSGQGDVYDDVFEKVRGTKGGAATDSYRGISSELDREFENAVEEMKANVPGTTSYKEAAEIVLDGMGEMGDALDEEFNLEMVRYTEEAGFSKKEAKAAILEQLLNSV